MVGLRLLCVGSTFPSGKGTAAVETHGIALIIISVFAFAALVLMIVRAFMQDLRAFMRDLARTIEIWHELQQTWRGGRGRELGEDPRDD